MADGRREAVGCYIHM